MNRKCAFGTAMVLFALALVPAGCGRSASGSGSGSGTATRKLSAIESQAADAALAEVARHCVKGPDGWTTAVWEGTSFAPVEFVRQFKTVAVKNVQSYDLTQADRMNGFEWAGEVDFWNTPGREAGANGVVLSGTTNIDVWRQPGRWSQWVDDQPFPVKVQKQRGKWIVDTDSTLLRGRIPTAADYAKAGVK